MNHGAIDVEIGDVAGAQCGRLCQLDAAARSAILFFG
jgi:hypothetical protein